MPLVPGTRLGGYEILNLIGQGGMGEVYRARDPRLKRDIAIKVLPELTATDSERRARLEREAQSIAALNHPNIVTIHSVEQANGVPFLTMEYVEGRPLSDLIVKGGLPLPQILSLAIPLADAISAAHHKGITHRDLKPGNVTVTADGRVKVLDFGLAKLREPSVTLWSEPAVSALPTEALTGEGRIVGTVAYMSPEQAEGKPVDHRTDVFSLGVMLYEMATGERPFTGDTSVSVVTSIIRDTPRAVIDLKPALPREVWRIIRQCLVKDLEYRYQGAQDLRNDLHALKQDSDSGVLELFAPSAVALRPRSHRESMAWAAATLLLGAALFFAERPLSTPPATQPISFTVYPPENAVFSLSPNTTLSIPSFALSPDGHALVFSAEVPGGRPMLWVRSMDQVSAQQLAGTENAQDPTWDPAGGWIGFCADGKLKKVPAGGGAVQVITETNTEFRGGTWGPGDTILFASGIEPILSVNAAGGKAVPVTTIDSSRRERIHRNPNFLPDGRHFLYTIGGEIIDQNGVYVGSLDGKTKNLLMHFNSNAVYAPPGFVLFVDGDTLLAQDFDGERLTLKGQPFLVAEHVGRNTAYMGALSASRTGTIAYAGPLSQKGRLTWIDRGGHALGPAGTPEADYTDFRLSPDEKRLAASMVDLKTNTVGVWITDLVRGGTSRFASGALVTASALWSPDGSRLTFRSNPKGPVEFYERSAAGGGSERTLLPWEAYGTTHVQSANLVPTDWSPDGRQVIFSAPSLASGNDLWLLPLEKEGRAVRFIDSAGDQMHGNFSPDSHLVAYSSNESGNFEVYVETFPRSDRKWLVSTGGGYEPRWRADGHEIYYLSEDRKLTAVPVAQGPSFGILKSLFQTRVASGVTPNRTHYVASLDGQRFLVDTDLEARPSPITVVLNWTATLKK